MTLSAPAPIASGHDCASFDSGRPVLDEWLRKRALKNEETGASRTYVVCDGLRILGFYCLSAGAVAHAGAPGKLRRNMPDPIPVMLMGRLAVDRSLQGQGAGRALVKDAILRTLKASEIAGLRALLVHALDEEAARFYERTGFLRSPVDALTLMLPMETVRAALFK